MAIDEELALDAAGQLKQRFAEALQIRARWHIRRHLFGSQPAFELLAAVAPAFFGFVREALSVATNSTAKTLQIRDAVNLIGA